MTFYSMSCIFPIRSVSFFAYLRYYRETQMRVDSLGFFLAYRREGVCLLRIFSIYLLIIHCIAFIAFYIPLY